MSGPRGALFSLAFGWFESRERSESPISGSPAVLPVGRLSSAPPSVRWTIRPVVGSTTCTGSNSPGIAIDARTARATGVSGVVSWLNTKRRFSTFVRSSPPLPGEVSEVFVA